MSLSTENKSLLHDAIAAPTQSRWVLSIQRLFPARAWFND